MDSERDERPAAPHDTGPSDAADTAAADTARSSGRLVLGLGNPGERYRGTRHNLGFEVVEELARRLGTPLDERRCNSRVARVAGSRLAELATGDAGSDGSGDGGRIAVVTLAAPETFMNRSGHAARCLAELDGFTPADVLVVYDEVHLPLGRLRLRPGGSPGGHRGMESVVESLRSAQVPRLRLGCSGEEGPAAAEGAWEGDLVEYVLAPFTADERPAVDTMVGRAADACLAWLQAGTEAAMNRFNG